jgi:ATP-dependent DNA ligase
MSEKLDGVRAYWDGKQFLSRHLTRPSNVGS